MAANGAERSKTPEGRRTGAVALLASDIRLEYRVPVDREDGRRLPFGMGVQYSTFEAVKGISLLAREGEFIGLIGRNGSGKSTLLRVLAGAETPTSGVVMAKSRPQLLGVSAALQPNLSGSENIRLGLLAMGLTPEQAAERRERIVRLADIGDSIRRPMRTYSSGMKARLRFAISVAADPEILMIDEALSTGDAAFVQRSRDAMFELMEGAGTGFLVSHSSKTIESMCTRAIWLDSGELVADGAVSEVVSGYRDYTKALAANDKASAIRLLADYRQTADERLQQLLHTEQLRVVGHTDMDDF